MRADLVASVPSHFKNAIDCIFDQIIRAGGTGGDADGGGSGAEEDFRVGAGVFRFAVDVEVGDGFQGVEAGGVADEEGGELLFADFDEVGGVRAVVSADDEKEVHGFAEHFEESVLAFLSGSADGIEDLEVGGRAIAGGDGVANAALDLLGFAFEHGGLVSDADALEMEVGIEAFGDGVGEALQEGCAIAAVADVVADGVGFIECEDDEVVAFAVIAEGA